MKATKIIHLLLAGSFVREEDVKPDVGLGAFLQKLRRVSKPENFLYVERNSSKVCLEGTECYRMAGGAKILDNPDAKLRKVRLGSKQRSPKTVQKYAYMVYQNSHNKASTADGVYIELHNKPECNLYLPKIEILAGALVGPCEFTLKKTLDTLETENKEVQAELNLEPVIPTKDGAEAVNTVLPKVKLSHEQTSSYMRSTHKAIANTYRASAGEICVPSSVKVAYVCKNLKGLAKFYRKEKEIVSHKFEHKVALLHTNEAGSDFFKGYSSCIEL